MLAVDSVGMGSIDGDYFSTGVGAGHVRQEHNHA